MIQQVIHVIIISAICITWGTPLLLIFPATFSKPHSWYHSMPGFLAFLFFAGCVVLGILSSWICLLMPLRFIFLAILTFLLLLYLILFKRKQIWRLTHAAGTTGIRFSALEYIYAAVSIILFFSLGALKPVNFDTQIYHLQIIRWQSEYGIVPGIANLFPRFGLGSNWFNLISFFYFPWLKNENFSYVNIAFVIWFFTWLFAKCQYYMRKEKQHRNNRILAFFFFGLFLYFMYDWQLFRDAANSTNYDFAVTSFMIIIIANFIEEVLGDPSRDYFSFITILFSLAIVSFKFSGIFILFLTAYHLFVNRQAGLLVRTVLAGMFIVGPVLIKNFITSGYPLYPYPVSIGSPDWQLPKEMAWGIYHYIVNTNRFYNHFPLAGDIPKTPFNWVPYWFNGILIQHKIVLSLACASLILLVTKPVRGINYKNLRPLIIILLLMIAAWFFTAPDPGRFGYGVLLPAAFLVTGIYAGPLLNSRIYKLLLFTAAIAVGIYAFKKSGPLFENPQYLAYPMSTEAPSFQSIIINGITVHLPGKLMKNWDHRCYNTPLPCICEENPYLQPRGNSLKEGFRMIPQPDSLFILKYSY